MYTIGNLPCKSRHTCFKWNRKCPPSDASVCSYTACISNRSKVASAAPWRCRRPACWPALLQKAWSLAAPPPLVDQAGRTPLWIPPRSPAALSATQTSPVGPRCRRTRLAEPTAGCSGAESAGPSRGGRTVRGDGTDSDTDTVIWLIV